MASSRPRFLAPAIARAWQFSRGQWLLQPCTRPIHSTRTSPASLAGQTASVEHGAVSASTVPPPPPQSSLASRKEAIKNAKPFSEFLTDSFNRQHDYLRISITERCNLRCLYCMPEEGVQLSPSANMLTTPEIFYLSSLFVSQGVTKIRLTGGEPTVRRDIIPLVQQIGSLRSKGLGELALTTNGIALHRKLDTMVEAGLTGVNLSLDTLDPFQFQIMTRRKGFDAVIKSIDRILEMKKLGANVKLKVNCVVMRGLNEREIIPFVELGREKDIEVRFIEYMPFGGNKWSEGKMMSFQEMLDIIQAKYPDLHRLPGHKNDTSKTFQIPGFVGKVGFITSMTNDFCGSCNRLRITGDGNLKVCLHGNAEVSLRDILRQGNNGEPIDEEAFQRIKQIEIDRHQGHMSDETILGWGQRERSLLQTIGAAVKKKAEKHADLKDLAKMDNRPMILIDEKTLFPRPMLSGSSLQRTYWAKQPLRSADRNLSNVFIPNRQHLLGLASPGFTTVRTFSTTPSLKKGPKTDRPNRVVGSERKLYRKWLTILADEHSDFTFLPRNFEYIRQKYEMTDPLFKEYWQVAAASVLAASSGVRRWMNGKAQSKLKATQELIVQARVSREEMQNVPFNVPTWLPEHRKLMQEAESARARDLGPPKAEHDERMLKYIDRLKRELTTELDDMMRLVREKNRRAKTAMAAKGDEAKPPSRQRYLKGLTRREKLKELYGTDRTLGEKLWDLGFTEGWKYTRHSNQLKAIEEFLKAWEGPARLEKSPEEGLRSLEEWLLSLARNDQSSEKEVQPLQKNAQPLEKNVQLPEEWFVKSSDRVAQAFPADTMDEPQIAAPEPSIRRIPSEKPRDLADLDKLFGFQPEKPKPVVRYVSDEGQVQILGKQLPIRSRGEGIIRYLIDRPGERKLLEEESRKEERILRIRPVAYLGNTPGTTRSDTKDVDQDKDPSGYGHPLFPSSSNTEKLFRGLNFFPLEKLQNALDEEKRAERKTQRANAAETQSEGSTAETTTNLLENLLATPPRLNLQRQDIIRGEKRAERGTQRSSALAKEPIRRVFGIDFGNAFGNVSPLQPKLDAKKPNISKRRQNALGVENHAKRKMQSVTPKVQPSSPLTRDPADFYKDLIPPRPTLSDSLRLQAPASGRIHINDDFTVDLNADVPELQSQIPQMQSQLKMSFPRIDSMPYDVSKSNNQKTLQTWLKILVHRWQSRFEERSTTDKTFAAPIEEDIKAVLDQMVRDHSLSNEAAERMGSRFNEIFSERGDIRGDAGGSLDWDAFDAEGLTFLRDSTESKESTRAIKKPALVQQQKRPVLPRKFGPADFIPFSNSKYSTSSRPPADEEDTSTNINTSTNAPNPPASSPSNLPNPPAPSLPHLTPSGSAHMVSVSDKTHTLRTAIAAGVVHFSNATPLSLIRSNSLKKGDVLSVSRIAGIMAAKKCPDLIPLCHPIALTHVSVELQLLDNSEEIPFGGVGVQAKVQCAGPTGVEMEALTAVVGAALSVVDMCKAVDRGMRVMDVRVVLKEGGRSGVWREEWWRSFDE